MRSLCITFLLLSTFSAFTGSALDTRILPPGDKPEDARLAPLKDLDGYFPFSPPKDVASWKSRAEQVRQQMRIALGLLPEPTRTPLNAVVHGKVEREGYSVEMVYFEAMPGFFVTGNLYRPTSPGTEVASSLPRRMPAVLCPHGHWPDGRFMNATDKEVQKAMGTGAEKFESAAHSPLQARCVQLARMGCVVFFYDMIGYADSQQISYDIAHKFAKQRPEMNAVENWGLFSPQAESHAQSIMGLQTWSSMRAIDFVQSLPDVDPARIGVTGASGGATQTLMVAALDPRVTVAFPAVMVSTAMQGGCTCENACLLRVGTGNIEIAGLFAPKPMAMTSADDWTKEVETKGFPELKQLWALLGAPDKVALTAQTQFPHNYNSPSRAAMAAWFNKHFGIGLTESQLAERDFKLLTRAEMSVWDAQHPAPEGGPDFERKLLRWWHEDAQSKLALLPAKELRNTWGKLIGWETPGRTAFRQMHQLRFAEGLRGLACIQTEIGRSITSPQIAVEPAKPNGWEVLWLDARGKAGLFQEGTDQLRPEVVALARQGTRVIGIDLFEQGEFLPEGETMKSTPRVKNPREAAAFTFGYNRTLAALRVQDILNVLHRLQLTAKSRIAVVALDESTSPLAAIATALKPVDAAVLQPGAFRFGAVKDLQDPAFLPAAAKYGDVPAVLKLAAEHPLFIASESGSAEEAAAVKASGTGDRPAALAWLARKMVPVRSKTGERR